MSIPDAIRQIVCERAKFVWENNATEIKGITEVGRATCDRFDLNDLRYSQEDSIRATRLFWTQTGLHLPDDDFCEA